MRCRQERDLLRRRLREPEGCRDIPEFNAKLVGVLCGAGLPITATHPSMRLLRLAFQEAWHKVVEANEGWERGDWAQPAPAASHQHEAALFPGRCRLRPRST